jgi:hypothetical protein
MERRSTGTDCYKEKVRAGRGRVVVEEYMMIMYVYYHVQQISRQKRRHEQKVVL